MYCNHQVGFYLSLQALLRDLLESLLRASDDEFISPLKLQLVALVAPEAMGQLIQDASH